MEFIGVRNGAFGGAEVVVGVMGCQWGRLRPETVGHICGLRWNDGWAACGWVIYRMELDSPGGWWRAGSLRSPWPGVSVSLCVSVSLTFCLSKRPLCVGVCGAATCGGQARAGVGGQGRGFPAPGLKGPFLCLPASPHPPHPALLA